MASKVKVCREIDRLQYQLVLRYIQASNAYRMHSVPLCFKTLLCTHKAPRQCCYSKKGERSDLYGNEPLQMFSPSFCFMANLITKMPLHTIRDSFEVKDNGLPTLISYGVLIRLQHLTDVTNKKIRISESCCEPLWNYRFRWDLKFGFSF